jgi:Tfp pilus assembly protein FimV
MKSMRLLVCGVMISLTAAAAFAQSPPPRPHWPAADPARTLYAPAGQQPTGAAAQPAPRGDLRGDIASNARTRAARHRNGPQKRR